jgi:hypothetical protein
MDGSSMKHCKEVVNLTLNVEYSLGSLLSEMLD